MSPDLLVPIVLAALSIALLTRRLRLMQALSRREQAAGRPRPPWVTFFYAIYALVVASFLVFVVAAVVITVTGQE